jgi:hypothetical protein
MNADSGLFRARIETTASELEGILIWAEEFVWQFSCFWGSGSLWQCGRWWQPAARLEPERLRHRIGQVAMRTLVAVGGTAGMGIPLKAHGERVSLIGESARAEAEMRQGQREADTRSDSVAIGLA